MPDQTIRSLSIPEKIEALRGINSLPNLRGALMHLLDDVEAQIRERPYPSELPKDRPTNLENAHG